MKTQVCKLHSSENSFGILQAVRGCPKNMSRELERGSVLRVAVSKIQKEASRSKKEANGGK